MFTQSPIIFKVVVCLILSVSLSYYINKLLIYIQKKYHIHQVIRDELIVLHHQKENTPILGGGGILLSIILSLLFVDLSLFNKDFICLLTFSLGYFLIGFIDDLMKVIKKDYHGEKAYVRLIFEIILAMLFLKYLGYNFIDFQFLNIFNNHWYLGFFSILIFIFILVGSVNSMNLSDGLDGLCSMIYLTTIMPFIIYCFKVNELSLGFLLLSSFGAVIGFIILNIHPSKMFMGDSGSLFLGSLLGIAAIKLHLELVLAIAGIVLIIETISVIVQVISYKITKKRIFLMAPLHHHLELKGYSEEKVVLIFTIISYFFSLCSLFIFI